MVMLQVHTNRMSNLNGQHQRQAAFHDIQTSAGSSPEQKYFVKPSSYTPPLILEPGIGTKKLIVFNAGDVHLDNVLELHKKEDHEQNGSTKKKLYFENPERIHFRKWLTNDVLPELENRKNEVVLVLNGDIIDFNASCGDSFFWDEKTKEINNEAVLKILNEIIKNNQSIFNELKEFLNTSENSKIVYTFGNHDKIIEDCKLIQDKLLEYLMPNLTPEKRKERFIFTSALEIKEMGLHIEHCHRLDPFNYSEKEEFTWGDWYTVKMVNGLFKQIENKLQSIELPKKVFDKLQGKLKEMTIVRPTSAIPMYFPALAERFRNRHSGDATLARKIDETIKSFSQDFGGLLMETPIIKKLKRLPLFPESFVKSLLSNQTTQAFLVKTVGMIEYWKTDSNKDQIKEVLRFEEKRKDLGIFVGAHTHNHADMPGKIHYFNPGAWKPVISAYRRGWEWFFPENSILNGNALRLETNLMSTKRRRHIRYKMPPYEGSIFVNK